MKTIKQNIHFKAAPHVIFEMLMDSKKHEEFTGAPAVIHREVNGSISCYDGWIEGKNVEIKENAKIVQKWRGKDWPENQYSTATFDLKSADDGGTDLEFKQTEVPDDKAEHVDKGWHEHYWDKMKKFLEKTST